MYGWGKCEGVCRVCRVCRVWADNAIASVSPLLLIENKALNIVCNYTNQEGQHVMVEWKWFKEEVPYDSFTPEDKQRITRDSKDGSLFISKANKNDIGKWRCEDPKNPQSFTKIIVRSKPWMYMFEEFQKTNYKSANIVEGQRFHLKCEVMEDYRTDATIEWFMYNESDHLNPNKEMKVLQPTVESSDGTEPHIKISRVNNSLQYLTIEKVEPTDRYYYVCIADNGVSTVNNTILLRVKDKLGALWPFLGIVAEVVILCTIIFIYEKRRIKPDFDDTEDNNTEPKGTQDRSGKSQDVRQRK
ncbi:unnamed protein product [Medioppia subpectinata]|uniref:Soluble interferon alpha/beta receptor OPG204 n=1 Tax=Medioppia subpectinata TaxID=1979941 RepID=A0A7R9Q2K7_9ACAR|nr:unnamed protein product [Medioppia subpectinata]CAG2109529.1 unnamed protein product [Medioppia subpectinata]